MAHSVFMSKASAKRAKLAVAVGLIGGLLSACSSPPVPTDTYYNLTAGRDMSVSVSGTIDGTVEVPPFKAEGVINERAIVYRESATVQKQYTYHYWSEPPAIMMQRSLIDALRGTRVFDQVVAPEVRADREYELIGTLRSLEHVVGGSGQVVVEFDIGLRRVRGNDTIFLNTYRTEARAGGGVGGAVTAMSSALDTLLGQALKDIADAGL